MFTKNYLVKGRTTWESFVIAIGNEELFDANKLFYRFLQTSVR